VRELLTFLANKKVPRHTQSHWYIFGGLTLLFFIIQLVTGVLLLLYYSPTPDSAHESVQFIMTQVPFGWLIRSMHSWSANLMIACVLIHLFSVYFMKAYRRPREMMWFSGVILLMIVLGFGFTGYLLPWDTTAYFATQIGTEIPRSIPVVGEFIVNILRGGEFIAEESLRRLFALHVALLPLISIVVVLIHLVLNQVHGTSTPIVAKSSRPGIPFYPNYVYRDAISWTAGLIVLSCFILMFPAQLGPKADPLASAPLGIKPEWYFLTLYQTLRFVPAQFLGFNGETIVNLLVMVAGILVFMVPVLDRNAGADRHSPAFTWFGIGAAVYVSAAITLAYLT
jgi:cytochrome b6